MGRKFSHPRQFNFLLRGVQSALYVLYVLYPDPSARFLPLAQEALEVEPRGNRNTKSHAFHMRCPSARCRGKQWGRGANIGGLERRASTLCAHLRTAVLRQTCLRPLHVVSPWTGTCYLLASTERLLDGREELAPFSFHAGHPRSSELQAPWPHIKGSRKDQQATGERNRKRREEPVDSWVSLLTLATAKKGARYGGIWLDIIS